MNLAHLHLLLNHFPVIGTLIGLGLYVGSIIGKSEDLKRAGLVLFLGIASLVDSYVSERQCCPAGDQDSPRHLANLDRRAPGRGLARLCVHGGDGRLRLVRTVAASPQLSFGPGTLYAVLLLSVVTAGLMANAANIGGAIRHSEILAGSDAAAGAGIVGLPLGLNAAAIGHFVAGGVRWAWPTCQTLHFMGLSLLMGVVFVVDLRVLGVMKNVSFAAVHRLLPWGMLGFGLNLFTGMCISSPLPSSTQKMSRFTGRWLW